MKDILLRWLLWAYPEAEYAALTKRPWVWFRRVHIGRSSGDVYLQRFYLLKTSCGALYLHRFFRGDEDQCLHDHPWWFVSWILKGGYFEETPNPRHAADEEKHWRFPKVEWYGPGSVRFCPATHRHRVGPRRVAEGKRVDPDPHQQQGPLLGLLDRQRSGVGAVEGIYRRR